MEKMIRRITNIIIIALTAIAFVASLFVAFTSGESAMALNTAAIILYVMAIIAILMIIVFAVAQIASSKKQMIKTLIMLAIVVVIVLISYFAAPAELSEVAVRVGVSESAYKWIGAAVNVAYIAFIGVIVALLGSFIYIKIKK